MKGSCPSHDELTGALDGQLTEERAAQVREHLGDCSRCREQHDSVRRLLARLAAPLGPPNPRLVDDLMARLDAQPAEAPAASRWRRWSPAAGLALAASLLVAVVGTQLLRRPADEFAPRGGGAGQGELERLVGLDLLVTGGPPRALANGDRIRAESGLMTRYRNRGPSAVYALVFAIDAAREIHWLQPGYSDPKTNPCAVKLEAQRDGVLAEAVQFEDLPPGALQVLTLVTREPLCVGDVEGLPPEERDAGGVARRWPNASLRLLSLSVEEAAP